MTVFHCKLCARKAQSAQYADTGPGRGPARSSRASRYESALALARPAGKDLRDLAGTLDEQLHDRTKGSIFQRHDPHRISMDGQFDRKRFERISLAMRAYN